MTAYAEYFLNSRADVVQLELMRMSHPAFSQSYCIVRNAAEGVVVDLSSEETGVQFDYVPTAIERAGSFDDLDAGLSITFGDVGEILQPEIANVAAAGGFLIKPTLEYWVFRSDDLSAPIFGPLTLEVPAFAFDETGATFSASAPVANSSKTGERYTTDRFPMQRGFY